MLVVKSKYQNRYRKYIVGRGLARINSSETSPPVPECCDSKITSPVSNSIARKALSNKSKELLEGLKKRNSSPDS
jgi:hypothetical protein